MNRQFGGFKIAATFILTLLLSAMMTVPAFADGEAPPVDSPPAEAATPPEGGAGVETPAETVGEVNAPAVAESGEPAALPELLEALPETTGVVITNAEGEIIPLATEEAADAVVNGDPRWCAGTGAPTAATCSPAFASFTGPGGLLEWLNNPANAAFVSKPGTIWIRWDYNYDSGAPGGNVEGGTPIEINPDTVSGTMENFALTIQGGWNGVLGSAALQPDNPATVGVNESYSYLAVPLWLTGWNAPVTLKNIIIDGASFDEAADNFALFVETSGAVILNGVTVQNSENPDATYVMSGALVDNTLGAASDVTVTNSVFDNNEGGGLTVLSNGVVTFNNVVAKNNDGGPGAVVDNSLAAAPKNVVIGSGSQFTGNWGNGLQVYSIGAINITDLYVVGNQGNDPGGLMNGAWLDNSGGTMAVTLSGVSVVSENNGGGLAIFSGGAVNIGKLVANSNPGGSGLYVNNSFAPTAQPVTVAGPIETKFNGRGIRILSKGKISLANVTSTNNDSDGVHLTNNFAGFASDVVLTGANRFMHNGASGLWVDSLGAISVSNLDVSNNGFGIYWWDDDDDPLTPDVEAQYDAPGVHLDNSGATAAKPVTLTGKAFVSYNDGTNLEILSAGAVSVANLTAHGSTVGGGAVIDNRAATAPQNVTITGYAQADDNQGGNGLFIQTKGAVTIANLSANRNSGAGAEIYNTYNTLTATSPKPAVTLTGSNSFYGNGQDGLAIESHGMITVNNVRAGDNNWTGVYLFNRFVNGAASTIAGVSVLNAPTFNPEFARNGINGLTIFSHGNVLVNDFDAYENGTHQTPGWGYGVYINNSTGTGNVTIGTARANWYNGAWDNFLSGVEIRSAGAVIINNIGADDNGGDNGVDAPYGYGVYVDNTFGVGKPVNVNGRGNWFDGNYNGGLRILSKGVITTNNVSASYNTGIGVYLDNRPAATPQAVNVNNVAAYEPEFARNGGVGLLVYSLGNIKVMDFRAYENGSAGILLENDYTGSVGNITVGTTRPNWRNEMHDNYYSGIEVLSNGVVTLSNLDAWWNGRTGSGYGYGVRVINSNAADLPKNVILNGVAWFDNNYSGGLLVISDGAITVNNLRAHNSAAGIGAKLDNSGSAAPQNVTINGYADFWGNNGGGLQILSKGAIVVNNLEADDQWDARTSDFGAYLDNSFGSGAPVTINGYAKIYNNDGYGLRIISKGVITVNSLVSNDNNGYGALLDNTGGTAGVSLLGAGADFSYNGGYGLQILTNGLININSPDGLDARSNGDFGVLLDNTGGTAGVTIGVGSGGNGNGISRNYGNGLEIYTNGAVTLGNLTANNNGYYDDASDEYFGVGALIDNSGAAVPQNVTLTGSNTFNNNWTDGLVVFSKGVITTNNLSASRNGVFDADNDADGPDTVHGIGVTLDNCVDTDPGFGVSCAGDKKPVNVNGSNLFEDNWDGGLFIYSDGAVKTNNVTANLNGTGVYIENGYDAAAPQTVTLAGDNNFHENGYNGLEVYSYGVIALNNVIANWNGQSGVSGSGVVLDNSDATAPADVRITGENYFTGNYDAGLVIFTDGNMLLNNIATYFNGHGAANSAGAILDNSGALATKTITLTGSALFYSNDGDGLRVNAAGNVTLNNVVADNNSAIGANVSSTAGNVLISCGSMTNNSTGWRVVIGATKTLTLNGVFAYGNSVNENYLGTLPIVRKLTCP